jgi:hypothetical protein
MNRFIPLMTAAAVALSAGIAPASAGVLTAPAPGVPATHRVDIIQVRDHHHHHWHAGHRFHGYDGYYDNDEDSGVLFKSFVTGTLFRHDDGAAYYSARARDCATRYRSYDPADNTYQPSRGPRVQCR